MTVSISGQVPAEAQNGMFAIEDVDQAETVGDLARRLLTERQWKGLDKPWVYAPQSDWKIEIRLAAVEDAVPVQDEDLIS